MSVQVLLVQCLFCTQNNFFQSDVHTQDSKVNFLIPDNSINISIECLISYQQFLSMLVIESIYGHRIIEGLEEILKVAWFQTSCHGRNTFHCVRLLKGSSNLVLNASNDVHTHIIGKTNTVTPNVPLFFFPPAFLADYDTMGYLFHHLGQLSWFCPLPVSGTPPMIPE